MESSKVFGGSAEECHSSESGWTMYIGSPIHGDDNDEEGESDDTGDYVDNNDGGSDDTDGNHDDDDDDDDSDDSMASDASSGPSYPYGNGEARHDMAHFKHNEKEEDDGKVTGSDKKATRQMEKQKAQLRVSQEKEEVMFAAKRASAQSDSKVRTNVWIGKRK